MRPEDHPHIPVRRGRAASYNPPTRFGDPEHIELADSLEDQDLRQIKTEFVADTSKRVLSKNTSPDLSFDYSINPYRGCEHGCIYCYARPTHEYLGYSAGLDFETKIVVKYDVASRLRAEFDRQSWKPQTVLLSGNTDPYQPVERRLQLTRSCLEVFLEYGNPVSVITKNALITRDLDVLKELASKNLTKTIISVTTLDAQLASKMEPRTSIPAARLRAISELAEAGIPVGVNVAPIIPGITDEEIPAILSAAREAGATHASYIVMRLPGAVKELFVDWLHREFPDRVNRVLHRIEDLRGGRLSDSRFGHRQKGEGQWAEILNQLFRSSKKRLGYLEHKIDLSVEAFRRPTDNQLDLF